MSLNRRHFVGMTVATGLLGSVGIQHTLLELFSDEGAEQRVFDVLRTHFNLPESARRVIPDFVASLRYKLVHRESPEYFERLLSLKDENGQDAFAAYVMQEFVICTNYYAVQAGHETELNLAHAATVS